jgi:isopenicillin-N epimerase
VRPYSPESPWRLDPDVIQLNHGAYGACPVPVLEAQAALRERMEANPTKFFARDVDGLLADTRAAVGRFLDAEPDSLAFLPNATTAVSTVLASLRFAPGDELLTTNHEYNATLQALREAAARDGATVVVARIPFPIHGPDDAIGAVLDAVTSRTRLALVSHATSPTAVLLPVREIVAALAARGIDTLVDAAHAPGMIPFSVRDIGAAYWTGNLHKWVCTPKSTAALSVREDRRAAIRPLIVSHGWNDVRADRPAYRKEFDWLGTVDLTAYLSIPASIDAMGGLLPGGWPALMAANHELAIAGQERLAAALGVAPPAPSAMIGSMAVVPLPGVARSDEAARALERSIAEQDRIEVPLPAWPVPAARHTPGDAPERVLLRISAQRFNDTGDFETLVASLSRRGLARG